MIEYEISVTLKISDMLINCLIIWCSLLLACALIYMGLVINSFLQEIEKNKDMLKLLPISFARDSHAVRKQVTLLFEEDDTLSKHEM